MKLDKVMLAGMFILLTLSFVSADTSYMYGMMDNNGQFYQYGMMDSSNQFYPMSQYGNGMMGSMMYGMYGGYGGGGMMVLGWITYILIIALIVVAIYWLIKSANRKK